MMYENDTIDKVKTLLQFAKKSGKVVLGHDAVIKQVKKQSVGFILIAEDLSQNTIESLRKNTENSKINMVKFGSKGLFLNIFEKYTGIVGITDGNFIKGIKKHLSSMEDDKF